MRLRFLTRRHYRARFIWGVIFGLIVTQGVFTPLVLCMGGNGHLATETTHVPSPQHDDDGACVDAPVLAAAEKRSRSEDSLSLARDTFASLLTLALIPLSSEADLSFRRFWPCDGLGCDPVLPALRTVVLLT